MNIRNQIVVYFSLAISLLLGLAFLAVYTIFSEFREESFQQKQKEKITTTIRLLAEFKEADNEILENIDRAQVNELLDEKMIIFNKEKKVIYTSIDDTPIPYSGDLVNRLNETVPWIEMKDEDYDVVAVYVKSGSDGYYCVSKAYDANGYDKLRYLSHVLLFSYGVIVIIFLLISLFLASKISTPLVRFTEQIRNFNFTQTGIIEVPPRTGEEIEVLVHRFNELMMKVRESYEYQRNAVHHISHEIKTPLAVVLSTVEQLEQERDIVRIKSGMGAVKIMVKNLGDLTNALLEIARLEAGSDLKTEALRMDEVVYDVIENIRFSYPDALFQVEFDSEDSEEMKLTVWANRKLMTAAVENLMVNSILYSTGAKATVLFSTKGNALELSFSNDGETLSPEDQQRIFDRFYRGNNSRKQSGFGLGLVLVKRVIDLHDFSIAYRIDEKGKNVFTCIF